MKERRKCHERIKLFSLYYLCTRKEIKNTASAGFIENRMLNERWTGSKMSYVQVNLFPLFPLYYLLSDRPTDYNTTEITLHGERLKPGEIQVHPSATGYDMAVPSTATEVWDPLGPESVIMKRLSPEGGV